MCAELPGIHFGSDHDLVFCYLEMPFGRNGAMANFAIFGDAISAIHSRFGVCGPSWCTSSPFQSRLYVADDGMLFDIRNRARQPANTDTWGYITRGVLGKRAINTDKLGIGGAWSTDHTLIGFDVYSELMTVRLPEPKVTGARALFGNLETLPPSRAVELLTIQKLRGRMGNFRAPNSMWGILMGPVDMLPHYTDEKAHRINCPVGEIWDAFWNSSQIAFSLMESED